MRQRDARPREGLRGVGIRSQSNPRNEPNGTSGLSREKKKGAAEMEGQNGNTRCSGRSDGEGANRHRSGIAHSRVEKDPFMTAYAIAGSVR
jgi:hypothetical protein